ncbi:MAG: DUF4180 domain-containing protein [Myxococcota bacterium]
MTSINGYPALVLQEAGPPIRTPSDASDVVAEALGAGVELVVIPRSRLSEAFFDLRSGLAGDVTQKFVNYRIRLIVVGDIDAELAASKALRDYVREANRGRHISFVRTLDEVAPPPGAGE